MLLSSFDHGCLKLVTNIIPKAKFSTLAKFAYLTNNAIQSFHPVDKN